MKNIYNKSTIVQFNSLYELRKYIDGHIKSLSEENIFYVLDPLQHTISFSHNLEKIIDKDKSSISFKDLYENIIRRHKGDVTLVLQIFYDMILNNSEIGPTSCKLKLIYEILAKGGMTFRISNKIRPFQMLDKNFIPTVYYTVIGEVEEIGKNQIEPVDFRLSNPSIVKNGNGLNREINRRFWLGKEKELLKQAQDYSKEDFTKLCNDKVMKCLVLFARGNTDPKISEKLSIAESTVDNYLKTFRKRMGIEGGRTGQFFWLREQGFHNRIIDIDSS